MLLFWSDSDFWLGKLNLKKYSKSKLWSILQIIMKLLTFKSKKNDFLIRITWKPKKGISEELMPIAWHPKRWWDFCMSEDIELIFTD